MAEETETTTQEGSETEQTSTESEQQQNGQTKDEVPPEVRRALAKANKEAERLRLQLKGYEDRDKTEQQKLTESAAAAEARAVEAEMRVIRIEVGTAKGLSPAQAKRLVGTTKEELEADADEMVADFKPGATNFDGGARRTAAKPNDMNALIRRAAGHG